MQGVQNSGAMQCWAWTQYYLQHQAILLCLAWLLWQIIIQWWCTAHNTAADDAESPCEILNLEGKHCLTEQSHWKSSDVRATADWLTAPCAKTLAVLNATVLSHWMDLYDICNETSKSSTDRAQNVWKMCVCVHNDNNAKPPRTCRSCSGLVTMAGANAAGHGPWDKCTGVTSATQWHTINSLKLWKGKIQWTLSCSLPQRHELLQQESY